MDRGREEDVSRDVHVRGRALIPLSIYESASLQSHARLPQAPEGIDEGTQHMPLRTLTIMNDEQYWLLLRSVLLCFCADINITLLSIKHCLPRPW
jgi:hypothetical protein